MGLPYSKFFWADYFNDTRMLSLEARGAWMDILCHLAQVDSPGKAGYKISSWARLLGVSKRVAKRVIDEIDQAGVGEVSYEGDLVFVSNFRIKDEFLKFCEKQTLAQNAGKLSAKIRRKVLKANKTIPTDPITNVSTDVQQTLEQNPNESSTIPLTINHYPERESTLSHENPEIPTLDEVKQAASMMGILESSAISFWEWHECNNGWIKNGSLIKWRIKLPRWAAKDKEYKTNGKNTGNQQKIDRSKGTANEGLASQYAGVGLVDEN